MANVTTLATVASIIASFCAAMLVFRIQRELQAHERLERTWIPWADWLLIAGGLIALLLVVLPLVMFTNRPGGMAELPAAACAAATVLVAGYVPAILAHYRLLFGAKREGPRSNPEPAERVIVLVTLLLAAGALVAVLLRYKYETVL